MADFIASMLTKMAHFDLRSAKTERHTVRADVAAYNAAADAVDAAVKDLLESAQIAA